MKKIDMSEQAVLRRLKQVDQLRDLSLSLKKAKPISDESAARLRDQIRTVKKPRFHSQTKLSEPNELPEKN